MKIKKAVFPAAGLGTRFLPATKAQPKEMLPLVDKPMIQYVVEEAVDSGIEQIVLVTGRGKRAIEDHFDKSWELEHFLNSKEDKKELLQQIQFKCDINNFVFIRQKEALGLGHAIGIARTVVGNEPFAVLLGDDIIYSTIPALKQLINIYEQFQCSVIAIQEVPESEVDKYGVIQGEHLGNGIYKVNTLYEKQSYTITKSNLAIIGRYILTPQIFEAIDKTEKDKSGEIQITHSLSILSKVQNIYAYKFEGIRYDAGSKLGFLKATVEMALRRKDIGREFLDYLKSLDLNEDKWELIEENCVK